MTSVSNPPHRSRLLPLMTVLLVAWSMALAGRAVAAAPPAPTDVVATDRPWDGGGVVEVTWTPPQADGIVGYQVWRSWSKAETAAQAAKNRLAYLSELRATAYQNEVDRLVGVEGLSPEDAAIQADRVADLAMNEASLGYRPSDEAGGDDGGWTLVDTVDADVESLLVTKLDTASEYTFAVSTVVGTGDGGTVRSGRSDASPVVVAAPAPIDLTRAPLFIILALLCGVVLFFILRARQGVVLKIRTIAGLAAVDEAVGRATEMGRPMLYINGIQDMDDLQNVTDDDLQAVDVQPVRIRRFRRALDAWTDDIEATVAAVTAAATAPSEGLRPDTPPAAELDSRVAAWLRSADVRLPEIATGLLRLGVQVSEQRRGRVCCTLMQCHA